MEKVQTWVGFGERDGEYPRLNLIPFPLKLITLEKPEASTFSQASQESSSPVKSAWSPYKKKNPKYIYTPDIKKMRIINAPITE